MWEKLSKNKSALHGRGCAKLIANDGREYVVSKDNEFEKRPQYIGTYNYINPRGLLGLVGHTIVDVIPYYFYGNSYDDPTSVPERIVITLIILFNKDNENDK